MPSYSAIDSSPESEPSPFADYVLPGTIVLVLLAVLLADLVPAALALRERRTA